MSSFVCPFECLVVFVPFLVCFLIWVLARFDVDVAMKSCWRSPQFKYAWHSVKTMTHPFTISVIITDSCVFHQLQNRLFLNTPGRHTDIGTKERNVCYSNIEMVISVQI